MKGTGVTTMTACKHVLTNILSNRLPYITIITIAVLIHGFAASRKREPVTL